MSDAERRRSHLTTIGAVDKSKAERLAERKARKRDRDRLRRQRQRQTEGAKPRAEYEAQSLNRTKPWERLGMSRRTWYRARQAALQW